MFRKLFLFVPLLAVASATLLAQPSAREIIPAGTLLQCTLDEPNLSSKTVLVGDPVLCHLGPLGSFGHSAFPRGAMLGGHFQDYKNPGHFVGKGWMQLEFDRMILPGEQVLPVSTKVVSAPHMKVDAQGDIDGKGHAKRDAIEWAIPIMWPIKILTLPGRGPYPALKGESRISLRLMDDVEVPFSTAAARASIPMPPWASPSSYQQSSYQPSSMPILRPATMVEQEIPVTAPSIQYEPRRTPEPFFARSENDQPLTVVALKDGAAFVARDYWVEGGEMHCVSDRGVERELALEKIDLEQTLHLNQERHVEFVLRSRDAVEQ